MSLREELTQWYIDDLEWCIWVLENPANNIPDSERKIVALREIIDDFQRLKEEVHG